MQLPKEFINILCCPKRICRGNLIEDDKQLKCVDCGATYPIEDGIPILFPNFDSPFIHKRHWDIEGKAKGYAKKYDDYLKGHGSPWGLYTHISEIRAVKKLTDKVKLRNKVIVDCGCGNGRIFHYYPEYKIKVGLDTSLHLLKEIKKANLNIWLVCAQIEDMPIKYCIADFSVSIRVFQHLLSPQEAFSEMVRITKPSGYIVLEVYNKLNLKELYKRIRMRFGKWGLKHDRYYSYREIEKWAALNFVKPIGYSGAGWGFHFYVLDLLKFRWRAPLFMQKIVFNFFLKLEEIVGTWPFFSKTLEKVCFIGSIQQGDQGSKFPAYKRYIKKLSIKKAIKNVRNYQKILFERNFSYISDDKHHLKITIDWLKRAQDATCDGGISRAFSLIPSRKSNSEGWQPSYPETTGYIIPTFIESAKILNDPDLLRRAKRMADWELQIMLPDGSVQGGNVTQAPKPVVFDTGQVIRGLVAIHKVTNDDKYLNAAIKSSQWILNSEYHKEGWWLQDYAKSSMRHFSTYNIYAVVPIVELGEIANRSDFIKLGNRVAEFTKEMQNSEGWFSDSDFKKENDSLLHTIAYTIDGLWDIGYILNNENYQQSAKKSLDRVILLANEYGQIPGRINENWQGTVDWLCLTGLAQIAVTCCKIGDKYRDDKYTEIANKIKELLKLYQNNITDNFGGKGAMYGSWPISSQYGQYQALNWSAKYFVDLLLMAVHKK